MRPSLRRLTLLAIAALVLGLVVPSGATAKAPSSGAKVAPELTAIVSRNLGDKLYADVVPGHVPGTVYYLAKLTSVNATSLAALRAAGATVRHRFDMIGWVSLSSTGANVSRVAAVPQVTKLVADKVLQLLTASVAPAAAADFADQTKRGTHDIGADAAWAKGFTGTGVTVGVVDSGIDENHSDLAGKVDSFVNCTAVVPSVVSNDVGSCLPMPGIDDNGHGTHVSGIIAGDGASNKALPGVAPDARLVGAKVCNAAGSCLNSSVMAGMLALALPKDQGGAGAQVINMSLGGGPSYAAYVFGATQETDADAEAQLVDAIADKYNVVWAIAAGNAGPTLQSVGSPSTASQSMSVGASVADWDMHHATADTIHGMNGNVIPNAPAGTHGLAVFSSRGPSGDRQIKPDFTAPGSYVVSTEASTGGEVHAGDAAVGNNFSTDPNYAVLSGTSMAAPAGAGAAALVIDGYHKTTGGTPQYYVVKAALANTAHGSTFEGPVTGLISSIKSNRLGMDPATLFPPRNDGEVGVTGAGSGLANVPDAILASTAGVLIYTPIVRNADGALTTDALQPNWSLDDVAPGESASHDFVLRGGPNMASSSAKVTFAIESPASEAQGIQSAPASWFKFPSSATAKKGSDASSFQASLKVPSNAAPGHYTAMIVATAKLSKNVTQNVRIPVQFFVPTTVGTELTGPIWASDTTDYSIVGAENPEGQIYTDWSMVPMRVPATGVSSLVFNVWDAAGQSTMDVFVFDGTGNEVDSTVDEPLHAVPAGAALLPTSADAPGTVTIGVVPQGTALAFGQVHAGDVVWLVLSDTKPAHPTKFETYHLKVTAA